MTARSKASEDTTRKERRDRYERVLRIVEHNTGDPQPAAISEGSLWGHATRTGMSDEEARAAIRAAIDNDDLVGIQGPDGRTRFVRATDDALLAAIEEEAAREHSDELTIGTLNQARKGARDAE